MTQLKQSQQHEQLLELLSLTMVSPQLLVQGGIFYKQGNKPESDMRNAQKALKKLHIEGYLDFKHIPNPGKTRNPRFYSIKPKVLEQIKKEKWHYHKISEGLVKHDSLTALFLVHMFRCYYPKGYSLKWYPPFDIGDKKCDGGLSLARNGKRRWFLIIEADTGTHNHQEIKDKITAYLRCLAAQPECVIFFLVSGSQRRKNLKQTVEKLLKETKQEHCRKSIKYVCPDSILPNFTVFPSKRPNAVLVPDEKRQNAVKYATHPAKRR